MADVEFLNFKEAAEVLAWAKSEAPPMWSDITEGEVLATMRFAKLMGLQFHQGAQEIRLVGFHSETDCRIPMMTMAGFTGKAHRLGVYRPGQVSFQSTPLGFLCIATCWVRDQNDAQGSEWYAVSDHARLEDVVDRNIYGPWTETPEMRGTRWSAVPTILLQERAEFFAARRALPALAARYRHLLPYNAGVPSVVHWENAMREAASAQAPKP